MTLTLTSNVLNEMSHFDTPLHVLPPGEPVVERQHAALQPNSTATLSYDVIGDEVCRHSCLMNLSNVFGGIIRTTCGRG